MKTTALRSIVLIPLLIMALQAFTGTLCAQIRHDYRHADQRALSTPPEAEENLTRLVDYLTENVYEDRNKVRAIYRWIADRIAYDIHALNNPPDTWPSPDEVLYRRKAICTGYAVLFDEMNRIAGLETELIVGHSKGLGTLNAGTTDFSPNHVWNAVKVDGHWALFDATWGAGYITSGGFFIPAFNDFYFMADPVKIVYTHLPEDPDWQLLVNPVSMKQYREHVWVRVPFFRHRLSVISHREAEITSYGELQIRLGVPGDVIISAALKFDGNPIHGNHIINYGGSDAQIDMSLNLRGTYTLEVYAREKESADDRLELAMIYNINNTQTPVASRMLPRQFGRFLTSRGNLISPRQYLLDEGQHQFDVVVPGARDVFVVNNDKMTALHRQGNRFYGTVPVISGDLKLAARFSGQDLDILVEYMVAM
jgi:transglutaminase/protease-like cytokinesis protein 3